MCLSTRVTGSMKQTEVAKERQIWRDSFTFQQAMEQCHETHTQFTVVVLQSGGLLCTHSSIRAGWTPIWGTEICPTHTSAPIMCQAIEQLKDCNKNSQQRMWHHLTGTPC
jgi:hypothetical protein